jgi:hypothetical protein
MFNKIDLSRFSKKQKLLGIGALALILIVIAGLVTYGIVSSNKKEEANRPKHVAPYVDGQIAKDQVENFYVQYINPNLVNRRKLVQQAGNSNLVFYFDYYQHGFDPIVCSTVMPTKVTTSLQSTGTAALVNVNASYPDGSQQKMLARVILGDGVDIDSISCIGEKGNLPYAR